MKDTVLKYFELLYDKIKFPIQVVEENGKIVYVNPEFTDNWGFDVAELKEYSIYSDSELRKNGIQKLIQKVFENKNQEYVENYADSLLRNRESIIPIYRTLIFYLAVDNKNYVGMIHEDRTEMILTEEEVKKSRDGYREAERLKNTFLNVLSHELRTPLNIILGYSSIIKENLGDKINPEDKVYLDNLYSGSERLFKSITQMLEFAQIEAGNYNVNIETIDLVTLFMTSIASIRQTAQEKKIEVKTSFKEDSILVDVDIHCVENAIVNLLSNAVKFTRQGFIEVELDIIESRDLAISRIKDTGVGISSEYLDHLFQPFSQEDLNIGRHYEGNGLGLALAKRYIEKMGGSLLVDSIKGVGSTFTFTLPLSKSKETSVKREVSMGGGNYKKILMLDDLSESYELINAFLKNKYQLEVHNFKDFDLELISENDFGVLIFDVNQNHWNKCLDMCKEIKEKDSLNRPLIVISTEYNENKITDFYEVGADKFLVKPFSKNDLVSALHDVFQPS